MNKRFLTKVLAVLLVISLTWANFVYLAVYAGKTYAASLNYELQNTAIEKTDLSFDAYFRSEDGQKVHTLTSEMNNMALKLVLSVSVTKGYLKEGIISINDSNFKFVEIDDLPEGIARIDVNNNAVILNQIMKGEIREIELPIEIIKDEVFNINNFSKDSKIVLTGKFVNDSGKEIEFNKSILVNLSISEEAEANLNMEIMKNVAFVEGNVQKQLVQLKVTSNVVDNLLPVKSSMIKVTVPEVYGEGPEYVSVVSTSTKATNGGNGSAFGDNDYSFENGIITINVKNEANENNEISWMKNVSDEYLLNLVYVIKEDEPEYNLQAESTLSLYNNEEKVITASFSEIKENVEETDNVVTLNVENKQDELAKGYMLVEGAANTEYSQTLKIDFGYSPIVKNINLEGKKDKYVDENGNEYNATTYYKEVSIDIENFKNVLGENGRINLVVDGVINTLDIENPIVVFEEEVSDLNITISKPVTEGTLLINTNNYIKSAEYDKVQTEKFVKLETEINGSVQGKGEMLLVNPTLQISAGISNSLLSTVVENENIELRASLITNNNTNRLFKNPRIEVKLPSYIEKIKLNDAHLLYDEGFEVIEQKMIVNDDGTKSIIIGLKGEQNKFNEVSSVEGMTLIINANLTVNKTAPSTTQKMIVTVTNNNEEKIEQSVNISYMAPSGIITLNSLSEYSLDDDEITSISGEEQTGTLELNANKKNATNKITIVNNYDYTIGDIKIFGRFPFEGNKDFTGKDLGSTFTAKLVSEIRSSYGIEEGKYTVYYSELENATETLDDSNGWNKNLELEKAKSYLIVLDTEMKNGDKVEFEYDIEIPADLSREEEIYSTYDCIYKNIDGALQGVNGVASAPTVGASTGNGPELKVELTADVENGAKVRENNVIEYTINVTNIGQDEAKDVEVSVDIPEYSYLAEKSVEGGSVTYYKNLETETFKEKIENIAKGETKQITMFLMVGPKIDDSEIEEFNSTEVRVKAIAKFFDEGNEIKIESKERVNPKEEGFININLTQIGSNFNTGAQIKYKIEIEKLGKSYKISDEELEELVYHNLMIEMNIPEFLKYEKTETEAGENNLTITNNKTSLIWRTNEFKNTTILYVYFTIGDISSNSTATIRASGKVDEMNEKINSKSYTINVGTPTLEKTYTRSTSNNIDEGEKIIYSVRLRNTSIYDAYDLKFEDFASEGLVLESIKLTKDEDDYSTTFSNVKFDLKAGEEVTIEITTRAKELITENSRKVSNYFEITGANIEKITSEKFENTVLLKVYNETPTGEIYTNSSISGIAWIDENRNGIRDVKEDRLSGITVMLINESGELIDSCMTSENGEYIFNNITPGKYLVAFMYDMANYDVTAYNVGEAQNNNDTVQMKVNISGTDTNCAVTNILTVGSSNIYNIDLGLVLSQKFDLSLTKSISSITVQTSKGTNTTKYNNSKLQKVEIPSKELNGATVAVEYTITVTNSGAIPGYATRVVDYLANTDLKFNSEINPDWYLGTDGNVYNTSLENVLLNPGETKTLKLVLTKQVTEKNTGITTNTAEIYSAYNDKGIEDYNSTPANKISTENDFGQADIIIGAKTGVVLYIGIVFATMIVLTLGIYVINKKVIINM